MVKSLRALIGEKKPGERLENDRELARRFQVSSVTVRAAMMELSGQGYVRRRVGSGTYVADRTAETHLAIVGPEALLQPSRFPFPSAVTMRLMAELSAKSLSYRLYLVPPSQNQEELPGWPQPIHLGACGLSEEISQGRINGLFSVNIGCNNGWTAELEKQHVPVVGVSEDISFRRRVVTDFEPYIRQAVRYLARFGRKRLALLSWHHDPLHRLGREDPRLSIFKDELERSGLPFNELWVRNDATPADASSGWEDFREIWSAPCSEKFDGLVVVDDLLFQGAASAILRAGIQVPRDLQIVTHWNKGSGLLCPFPVARYEFDPADAAREAIALLQGARAAGFEPEVSRLQACWHTEGQFVLGETSLEATSA